MSHRIGETRLNPSIQIGCRINDISAESTKNRPPTDAGKLGKPRLGAGKAFVPDIFSGLAAIIVMNFHKVLHW